MRQMILSALVALAVSLAVMVGLPPPSAAPAPMRESTYERVMRTGTLRCAYLVSPPLVMRDVNTGAMSGIMVDYMAALGQALDLKVEWTAELNSGTYLTDLKEGRYDLECAGGWPNALRGKLAAYSTPIYYFPFYAAARADDPRFDGLLEALNRPDVRVAGHDGGTNALIRERRFPRSAYVGLAASAPLGDALLSVASGKADVTFIDGPSLEDYMTLNPGQLRRVAGPPVRVIPTCLSMAAGEYRLQQMLDTATRELLYDGVIDAILDRHETVPGQFLRVVSPYLLPALEP